MTELTARTDRSLIRTAGRSVRHVAVTLVAPVSDRAKERPPVDVAFVLDRSGSMAGEKIELARDAILQGIAMLKPADRFAVIAYDTIVDVVMPLSPAHPAARGHAEAQLRQIRARGGTNLSGGWLAGCQQLAETQNPAPGARCLLMSDGCANQGIIDCSELERHSRELQQRGVVTSTFGVGSDFDEVLMSGMARAGGGHGYFIQHARQIGDLLTSELAESLEVVARGVSLSIHAPQGAKVEVLTDFDAQQDGDTTTIRLGTLVSGQSVTVVLRVTLPEGVEGDHAVLEIRAGTSEGVLDAPPVDVRWMFASHERNDVQPRETAVDLQVAGIYAARARRDALELNRHGDYPGARRLLERVAKRIEGYAGASVELQGLARALRAEAQQFEREMDSVSMKQAHYSSRAAMRSRSLTGKATRGRYDAQAYDVRLHRGVPVIDCDGAQVAIVTGTPASFGRVPVRLVGQPFHLPSSVVPGVTAESIGQYLGTTIDAVIGGDLLQQFECLIDLGTKRVVLSHGSLGCDGVSLRTPLLLDVPTAEITVGARQGVAFLDTGARLSYIDPAAVTGRPVGREKDFFPLVGEFETDVYEAEIELAGLRLRGRFGVLPQPLQQEMAALGAQWVIGSELLQQFPLLLDLQHHRIMIVQQQPSFMAIH
jgi:Ca-activated chloride channel family protein